MKLLNSLKNIMLKRKVDRFIFLSHRNIFQRFSSSQNSINQIHTIDQQQNQKNNIDSQTLLQQFKENAQSKQDTNNLNQYCENNLLEFKQRMEVEFALQVCQTAMDLNNNLNSIDSIKSILFFKANKIILNYQLGKLNLADRQSSELYAFYIILKDKLDYISQIQQTIMLTQIMQKVKQVYYVEKYLSFSIELLNTYQQINITKQQQFEIYYLDFQCSFFKQQYQESIQKALKAFEYIQGNDQELVLNLLIGLYLSYKKLGQKLKSQKILQELQKYPQFQNIRIDEIDQIQVNPFKNTNNQFVQDNAQQQNDRKNVLLDMFDEEYIQKIKTSDFIEYYSNIISILDSKKDILQIIDFKDKLAHSYFQQQNVQKAIELSLDSHHNLLKFRNYKLINDKITYQNLFLLKLFYFGQKDYQQSIQWGNKYLMFCSEYDYFDYFDNQIVQSLFDQLESLQFNNQFSEALEFTKFIEIYLDSFNSKANLFLLDIIKTNLNSLLNNTKEVTEYSIKTIQYYNQNKNKIIEEHKNQYYNMLLTCVNRSLNNQDDEIIQILGKEYLNVSNEFEEEKNTIKTKSLILNSISQYNIKQNQFQNAEEIIKQGLSLTENNPEMKNQYIKFICMYIPVCLKISKSNEAEHYLKIAQDIYDNRRSVIKDEIDDLIELLKYQSILNKIKTDLNKSLDFFTKQIVLQDKNNEGLSQYQRDTLKQLLKNPAYSQEINNLIIKHNIQIKE